jgi:hypothetical protein
VRWSEGGGGVRVVEGGLGGGLGAHLGFVFVVAVAVGEGVLDHFDGGFDSELIG